MEPSLTVGLVLRSTRLVATHNYPSTKIDASRFFGNERAFWVTSAWERLGEISPGGWKREVTSVRHAVTRMFIRRSIGVWRATAWFVLTASSGQPLWKLSAPVAPTQQWPRARGEAM